MKHVLMLLIGIVCFYTSHALAEKKVIEFENSGGCFKVFIDEPSGNMFSCKETPKVNYNIVDCKSRKVLENGDVEAHVHCPDSSHFKLEFKTSKGVVTALLDLKRESKGRQGIVTSYSVHESSFSNKDPHDEK